MAGWLVSSVELSIDAWVTWRMGGQGPKLEGSLEEEGSGAYQHHCSLAGNHGCFMVLPMGSTMVDLLVGPTHGLIRSQGADVGAFDRLCKRPDVD
jgi:hypothetical protein